MRLFNKIPFPIIIKGRISSAEQHHQLPTGLPSPVASHSTTPCPLQSLKPRQRANERHVSSTKRTSHPTPNQPPRQYRTRLNAYVSATSPTLPQPTPQTPQSNSPTPSFRSPNLSTFAWTKTLTTPASQTRRTHTPL